MDFAFLLFSNYLSNGDGDLHSIIASHFYKGYILSLDYFIIEEGGLGGGGTTGGPPSATGWNFCFTM